MQIIWDRLGSTFIGCVSGFILALVVSLFTVPWLDSIQFLNVVVPFVAVFSVFGLVMGEGITIAAIWAARSLHLLAGAFFVLIMREEGTTPILNSIGKLYADARPFAIATFVAGALALSLVFFFQ